MKFSFNKIKRDTFWHSFFLFAMNLLLLSAVVWGLLWCLSGCKRESAYAVIVSSDGFRLDWPKIPCQITKAFPDMEDIPESFIY